MGGGGVFIWCYLNHVSKKWRWPMQWKEASSHTKIGTPVLTILSVEFLVHIFLNCFNSLVKIVIWFQPLRLNMLCPFPPKTHPIMPHRSTYNYEFDFLKKILPGISENKYSYIDAFFIYLPWCPGYLKSNSLQCLTPLFYNILTHRKRFRFQGVLRWDYTNVLELKVETL